MGARWYQPTTATFTTRDTIQGLPDTPITLNRYTYAGANPTRYWDPNGRFLVEGTGGANEIDTHGVNNATDYHDQQRRNRINRQRQNEYLRQRQIARTAALEKQLAIDAQAMRNLRSGSTNMDVTAAIDLSPSDRLQLLNTFFGFEDPIRMFMRDGVEGAGLVVFTAWEITSGRITGDRDDGSAWWRAVNGLMLLDMQATDRSLATGTTTSDPAVQAWIDYRAAPSWSPEAQQALWKAHQVSLHEAIDASADLLAEESALERAFIGIVVENVDISALYNYPSTPLGAAGMDIYLSNVYPDYLATQQSGPALAFAHVAPFLTDSLEEYSQLKVNNLIGLTSDLWDVR